MHRIKMRKSGSEKTLHRPLALAVAALLSTSAAAANRVVWQIGRFDKSSFEYLQQVPPGAQQKAGQTSNDLVYIVGKSHTEDWPRFQPGSSNGLAG